jgi:hypothetical protein
MSVSGRVATDVQIGFRGGNSLGKAFSKERASENGLLGPISPKENSCLTLCALAGA